MTDKALSLTGLWSKLGELRSKVVNEILRKSEIEILQDEIKETNILIQKLERELGVRKQELEAMKQENITLYMKEHELYDSNL